ncbi:nucleotidyltransferase family protein [Eubacterium sp. 1001713B170207_170306_E7]|uniref:nucleotidyltransferase family protein n=1 Tax=Eubacterium sp. 1001713B170207_170306_E7 TaxID=2787097 RepID=UPI00189732C8|nr:nucleotidyltransferase family protein [Eubacterium sp. 1001713B170207_170306_E7]
MKENATEMRYLRELADSVLAARPPDPPPAGLNWELLWQTAKRLSMLPFIGYGVERLSENDQPPTSVMAEIRKCKIKSILAEAAQQHLLAKVLHRFDTQGVACLLGKDLSLKHLYPYPDIRPCEKIELFLRDEALPAADKVLVNLGASPVITDKCGLKSCHFGETTLIIKKLFYEKSPKAFERETQKYRHYSSACEWRPEILYKQLAGGPEKISRGEKESLWLRLDRHTLQRFYGFDAPEEKAVWNKKLKSFVKKQKYSQRNAQC